MKTIFKNAETRAPRAFQPLRAADWTRAREQWEVEQARLHGCKYIAGRCQVHNSEVVTAARARDCTRKVLARKSAPRENCFYVEEK